MCKAPCSIPSPAKHKQDTRVQPRGLSRSPQAQLFPCSPGIRHIQGLTAPAPVWRGREITAPACSSCFPRARCPNSEAGLLQHRWRSPDGELLRLRAQAV